MGEIKITFAAMDHLKYADDISEAIAEAARDKNSGLALRSPEYITEKIKAGRGVIALDGEALAGFCYINPWENDLFVAHSGLIVKPQYRGHGLAKALKQKAYELTRLRFPKAGIFGLTTSPAVKKINESLGYKAVPYNEITNDIRFWKGCVSCVHYELLCKNGFESCLCTAMLYNPEKDE